MDMQQNWNLLGHTWAVTLLKQHIAHDSVRHAYLFTGPPGLGRRSLALRFAQALNCEAPPAPGEYCDTCRSCRQTHAMQHPDLGIIQSESEGGTLKVDQVREIQRTLSLKPYFAPHKVALFLRFQEANANAQNALLKTLEEAPAYAVLILTADNAEQLLPTIVSRCEILRLRPLPIAEVEAHLTQHGAEPAQARLLASLSGGRPGAAIRLAANPAALAAREERLDDLHRLLQSPRRERFAYAEKLSKDKDAVRATLQTWSACWRDVMLRAAKPDAAIANIDREQSINALAARLGLPAAHRMVALLEQAAERLEKNVNARLLVENLMLDWPRM